MSSSAVEYISECFIKPKYEVEDSKHPYHLTSWGLSLLSIHYIQSGLLFSKPHQFSIDDLLESLKNSLSLALVHFYPLAGQFATRVNNEGRHECLVFIDCTKGPGAKFIHANLDMTVFDILSPTYVPLVVQSFFDLTGVTNHEGHTQPLLSVQVTELLDGIFIGVSMNHVLVDGTSFWHFWNTWSEIHEATNGDQMSISHPPVHDYLSPGGYGPEITLPFIHPEEFINRYQTPQLQVRIFHFSSESIRMLKEKANEESNSSNISSLQALTALVWRSIVRANHHLPHQQASIGVLAINNRHRMDPPLPENYFRNSVDIIKATTTVVELLEHSLGWAALLVHQSIANHTDKVVRESLKEWLQSPLIYQPEPIYESISFMMTMSPRFEVYGNEFGLGKPLAARNGRNNTFDGNLVVYPGYEGGGSMDLEICLPSDSMEALDSDAEFTNVVSAS